LELSTPPPDEENPNLTKRRSVRRCAFVASAEVIELSLKTRLSVRTSELSIGGCYIDTLNPFPEGTAVKVRIIRDEGVFETNGKVIYSHSRVGMGISFIEIAADQRSILENWLAEIVVQLRRTC
jgi:hypothetical protein